MIDNDALETILTTARDISTVVEIYASDAVPGTNGFDPHDALGCFAAVDGITFQGQSYIKAVKTFGTVNKTIGKEVNTCSITFSNVSRQIAQFEFQHGFEGLIMVVRVLSRGSSLVLTDTKIEFAGRCDKPESGDKDELSVSARFVLGSLDVMVPRRKYVPEDPEGRVSTDPEFEGFIFMPQEGVTAYSVRQSQRTPWGLLAGIVGFFFIRTHKTITKTLHWSSYSDLDANKSVPEVFGRAQIMGTHIGYADVGLYLQTRTAFCEGEILDLQNVRVLDSRLADVAHSIHYGKVGALNGDDPTYIAPGYYSRTSEYRSNLDHSTIDTVDPCPDIVAVVYGKLIPVPDTMGVWGGAEWTDNPAAHIRYLLTSADYYKLDESWIDDDYFNSSFNFNAELIFNTELSDFTFVDEG